MVEIITPQSEDTDKNPDSTQESFEDKVRFLKLIVTTSEIIDENQKEEILGIIVKHIPEYESDKPHYFCYHIEEALRDYVQRKKREPVFDFRRLDNLEVFIRGLEGNLNSFMERKTEPTSKIPDDISETTDTYDLPKAA